MKRFLATLLTLVSLIAVSCGRETPQSPAPETQPESRLEVYVHWGKLGIPDKRVEVLELSLEQQTSADGVAQFTIPAGTYTLRAYEINGGGPPLVHVDLDFTTTAHETTRIEVVDCLPCVAARESR
jgi:hypothetical protein